MVVLGASEQKGVALVRENPRGTFPVPPDHQQPAPLLFGFDGDLEHGGLPVCLPVALVTTTSLLIMLPFLCSISALHFWVAPKRNTSGLVPFTVRA
jgi:hypothetical protein